MLGGFITLVLWLAAASTVMLIAYSQREPTFPGYKGRGGPWTLALTAAGGVLAVWGLGALAGAGNVIAVNSSHIQFGLAYDSTLLNVGTWVLVAGFLAVTIVGTHNLVKVGQIYQ